MWWRRESLPYIKKYHECEEYYGTSENKFVDTIGSRIYMDMGEINLLYIYGMSV